MSSSVLLSQDRQAKPGLGSIFSLGKVMQVTKALVAAMILLFSVTPAYAVSIGSIFNNSTSSVTSTSAVANTAGSSSNTNPLGAAIATLDTLGPGLKAVIAFIAFAVALISLLTLRNFGVVLQVAGVGIFGSVGLTVLGSIMGAVV